MDSKGSKSRRCCRKSVSGTATALEKYPYLRQELQSDRCINGNVAAYSETIAESQPLGTFKARCSRHSHTEYSRDANSEVKGPISPLVWSVQFPYLYNDNVPMTSTRIPKVNAPTHKPADHTAKRSADWSSGNVSKVLDGSLILTY